MKRLGARVCLFGQATLSSSLPYESSQATSTDCEASRPGKRGKGETAGLGAALGSTGSDSVSKHLRSLSTWLTKGLLRGERLNR